MVFKDKKKEKIIIVWTYFAKTLQYSWHGSKYYWNFECLSVLDMLGIDKVQNMCKYAFE